MAAVTEQDRFDAAVKIITGLPKDGPFQPSNEMKLKFYSLYKQATLGPCTSPQPGFWDVVNRAKWSAWKSLGDMSKEEAMQNYVDALKQVVETMTLDNNVEDFLDKIGPMYEFVTDDGRVVTKRADIGSCSDEADKRPGNQPFVNGDHLLQLTKVVMNGDVTNGTATRSLRRRSSVEDEGDDEGGNNRALEQYIPQAVGSGITRKVELEGASDDEKFDDASDNQAFASAGPDVSFAQSSGTHSPLSLASTPRHRRSRATQSSDELVVQDKKSTVPDVARGRTGQLLSPLRERAAAALGQLLRQLPELDADKNAAEGFEKVAVPSFNMDEHAAINSGSTADSVVRAWAVLRRIHADQVRRYEDDDDWIIRRLKNLKRRKSSHRKHRGNGGHNDKRNNNSDGDNGGMNIDAEGAGSAQTGGSSGTGGPSFHRRSPRQLSGESGSSSNSSGTDSANLDFDPHVGAVLLRMHRELQHINRQLELVEGILITQQHMIRSLINMNKTRQTMRLCFFSNLPWRTIAFIVAWPVVVNVVVRIFLLKLKRRK